MYSPFLLWLKELSVFEGVGGLWYRFIPTRTGVQISQI